MEKTLKFIYEEKGVKEKKAVKETDIRMERNFEDDEKKRFILFIIDYHEEIAEILEKYWNKRYYVNMYELLKNNISIKAFSSDLIFDMSVVLLENISNKTKEQRQAIGEKISELYKKYKEKILIFLDEVIKSIEEEKKERQKKEEKQPDSFFLSEELKGINKKTEIIKKVKSKITEIY